MKGAWSLNWVSKWLLSAALLTVAACGDDEVILEGVREPIFEESVEDIIVNRVEPISLSTPRLNTEWTHVGGGPSHLIAHPVLRQPLSLAWSTEIGEGESRKLRISADPVVADNLIFTMDAESLVSAVDLNGRIVWTADLTPPGEKPGEGLGGGLAYSNNRLFVTSGYGEVIAVDAASGGVIWRQALETAASGPPTAIGDAVYVSSRNGTGWAIDQANGRILWEIIGVSTTRGVFGGPAPVAAGNLVVFPFGSGQLVAADRQSGERRWQASVAGQGSNRVLTRVQDLTGDPVVIGETLIAGTHSGRSAAFDIDGGLARWTIDEGAIGPAWVEGGAVFFLSEENRLVRADLRTGEIVWRVTLPFYIDDDPLDRKTAFSHFGPVLAGGRLLVVSDDAQIRSFDPASGALLSTQEMPAGAATGPVVAGGALYVITEDGRLNAFR